MKDISQEIWKGYLWTSIKKTDKNKLTFCKALEHLLLMIYEKKNVYGFSNYFTLNDLNEMKDKITSIEVVFTKDSADVRVIDISY